MKKIILFITFALLPSLANAAYLKDKPKDFNADSKENIKQKKKLLAEADKLTQENKGTILLEDWIKDNKK